MCLTSTNPDFDFEIGNSDFAVTHVFQCREFHPQSGSQLGNPAPDFMDFYVLPFSGKSKKDLFKGDSTI